MTQWTESQRKVISSDEPDLICSAAAGSGKTAVMIERIVRLIREGADPFSFLVITFTNAAAAEMKEKIRKRLLEERDDPNIAAAAEKAAAMEVSTIHAFCQHLIRQEFQTVGVDPFFQISTGAQREKLFNDAFHTACGRLRKEEDEDYLSFIRQYDQGTAREIVTAVWHFVMSLPDPFGWLLEKTENVPVDLNPEHPWFRTVSRMTEEQLLSAAMILRQQMDLFDEYEKVEAYRSVWQADSKIVEALRSWKNGRPVTTEELSADFGRLPAPRGLNDLEIDWKERYTALREQLKKIVGRIRGWIFADPDQQKREFREIRETLRGLRKLTEYTDRAYMENKRRSCVLDFNDLEHKALTILLDPVSREEVRERYSLVFVDECQDVSEIQDVLIRELTGEKNRLFMVGDVKQSIYRFRMARPDYFRNRMEAGIPGKSVLYLQENFRSRPEILETANTIFRDVMREKAADMDYRPSDELIPGLKDQPGQEPVRVDLLGIGENITRLETVAAHVADEIRILTAEQGYGLRDIVILMSEVSTDGPVLADLLREKGIDVFFDGKGDFFENQEVEVFRSLLMVMDNPHQDLPLLTVLVNHPFRMTEEELSLIRLRMTGKEKPFWQAFEKTAEENSPLGQRCAEVKNRLENWRFMAGRMPLGDYLWYLMEDAGLYGFFGAGACGKTAQMNLRNICIQGENARQRGQSTLREFLNYLTEQASGGEKMSAPALAEGDQAVRIMTMHRSKGLQFPVVFCLGLDKGLTGKPGGTVRLDADLGVCLRYKRPELRLSRKTRADEIFEWKKSHDVRAEKICLLYVAVTRAQRKLYLIGTEQDRSLWHIGKGDHRTLAASDYLDLVMPALLDAEKESTSDAQASKPWIIRIFDENQQKIVDIGEVIHSQQGPTETKSSATPVDELWKIGSEQPANPEPEILLKKYSVSALLQKAGNRLFMNEEQTPEEKRTPDYVARAMRRWQAPKLPAFMTRMPEADGAARGTVIHRFLSLMDLERIRHTEEKELQAVLEGMLAGMRDEGVFSPTEVSWIRPEKICRFIGSPLGRRMLSSPEVHREWNFNLSLPDRGMLVQGMIDCAFREEDGWILLDYKTDTIRDESAFVEEYRPQLAWYAVALENLTGIPVRERWLYALSVDKAFPVPASAEEHETAR